MGAGIWFGTKKYELTFSGGWYADEDHYDGNGSPYHQRPYGHMMDKGTKARIALQGGEK